eukprot:152609-Chlamydomonas_euryale.AAC.2
MQVIEPSHADNIHLPPRKAPSARLAARQFLPTCRFSISLLNFSVSAVCSASRCCAATSGEGSLRSASSCATSAASAWQRQPEQRNRRWGVRVQGLGGWRVKT